MADGEEALPCETGYRRIKAGVGRSPGRRSDPEGCDQRADVLLMEGEVRRSGSGSCPPDGTPAGGDG